MPQLRRHLIIFDDYNWIAADDAKVAVVSNEDLCNLIDGRMLPMDLNDVTQDLSVLLRRSTVMTSTSPARPSVIAAAPLAPRPGLHPAG